MISKNDNDRYRLLEQSAIALFSYQYLKYPPVPTVSESTLANRQNRVNLKVEKRLSIISQIKRLSIKKSNPERELLKNQDESTENPFRQGTKGVLGRRATKGVVHWRGVKVFD
ncbi:hypothetical protein [Brevibacillus choshinensis]|uniref:Transposase n=1 Tax=Brevibacillus choshinensis TaxID=54911 RepID=A0ABX7FUA4_BRECH|nr:hypothetical protein [Brevibacillus choshinensis]QRG69767.1 hypothetical protein JNE38_11955 [Brevibacillus choshinensis]